MPPRTPATNRRLLCEGWIEDWDSYQGLLESGGDLNLVFTPEVSYVTQKDKVWFAEGRATKQGNSLCESFQQNDNLTLVENFNDLELVERKLPNGETVPLPKDGRWFVEGPGQRSGVRNANKRYYPKEIWEKLFGDKKSPILERINERGMTGHFEHPKDGRTDGKEVALVTTQAKLQEDGVVWARHELLDTPSGLILQELTRKGVRWGVSTRGNGEVDESGKVSPETYILECWDAVMRPSTPGAYANLSKGAGADAPAVQRKKSLKEGDDTHTTTVKTCARCGQDHVDLVFEALDQPCGDLTHFAACPANGQPIMLKFAESAAEGLSGEAAQGAEVSEEGLQEPFLPLLEALQEVSGNPIELTAQLHRKWSQARAREDLSDSDKAALSDWLLGKVAESIGPMLDGITVGASIDESIGAVTEAATAKHEAGFKAVVEELQSRLKQLTSENRRLREGAGELRQKVAEAEANRDEAWRLAEAAEAAGRESSGHRELANQLIERTRAPAPIVETPETGEPVDEALELVLAAQPALARYRKVLEEATTLEQLAEMVEGLAPMIVGQAPKDKTAEPVLAEGEDEPEDSPVPQRSALRRGLMVESTSDVPDRPANGHQVSPGVKQAAAAVSKIGR